MKEHFSQFLRTLTVAAFLVPTAHAYAIKLNIDEIAGKFCIILNWVFTAAIITGIIMVVIAAFKYMTAKGDATKLSEAHQTFFYAAIGLAVAILAASVPFIIATFLGAESEVLGACGLA